MADTRTADNLVYEVAGLLGKVIAGESLGAVEYQTIDGKIDGVLGRISKIVYIGDRDAIPIELFDNIALMVAQFAGPMFSNGVPNMEVVSGLERDLRYLVANGPIYDVMKPGFF